MSQELLTHIDFREQFKTKIDEMKANELSKEQHVKQLSVIMKSLDVCARTPGIPLAN